MRLTKRTLAICCVALLVALAGCTGGPADSGADEDDEDEETPANETAANGSSGGDSVSTADGMTGQVGGGDTGGMAAAFTDQKRQIVESHAQTLTAAGTYTAVINTSWSGSAGGYGGQTSGPTYALTTTYADPNTGEYYQTFEIPMEGMDYSFESYSPAGENVTFTRTNIFGQTSYTRTEQPLDTSQALNPASTTFFDALDFESQGTVTRDGETLQRYVVNDVDQIENSAYFDGSVATIDVEVLYNPDRNLLQEISWRYTYQNEDDEFSSVFTVSYEDIGTTTVQEPGWLSEARQQATSTGSYSSGDFSSGDFDSGDFDSGDYNFTAPSGN